MMNLRSAIKMNAQRSLKGHWGRVLLVMLVFFAVNLLLSALDSAIFTTFGYQRIQLELTQLEEIIADPSIAAIQPGAAALTVIMYLVRLIIMAPLTLGVINWALELSDGRVNSIGSLFWAFGSTAMKRSILLDLSIEIKTGLFGIAVTLIPFTMVTVGTVLRFRDGISTVLWLLLTVVGALLALVAAVATMWFGARYFVARLLLCRRYHYTVREATRLSVAATRGHRMEIVIFSLSFLPWMLLCVLVLPILYVAPYMAMAFVMLQRYLFEDHLMSNNKLNLSDPEQLIVDDIAPEEYAARIDAAEPAPTAEPAEETLAAPAEEAVAESTAPAEETAAELTEELTAIEGTPVSEELPVTEDAPAEEAPTVQESPEL